MNESKLDAILKELKLLRVSVDRLNDNFVAWWQVWEEDRHSRPSRR